MRRRPVKMRSGSNGTLTRLSLAPSLSQSGRRPRWRLLTSLTAARSCGVIPSETTSTSPGEPRVRLGSDHGTAGDIQMQLVGRSCFDQQFIDLGEIAQHLRRVERSWGVGLSGGHAPGSRPSCERRTRHCVPRRPAAPVAICCVVHGVGLRRPSVNGTGRLARWRRTHPGSSAPSRSHRLCTTAQILAMSKRRGPTRCHHRHLRGASAIICSRRSASDAAQSLTNWRTATTLPRPSSRAIHSGRSQARNNRVGGSIIDATPSNCAGRPESFRSETGPEDRGLLLMHRVYCYEWCGREGTRA